MAGEKAEEIEETSEADWEPDEPQRNGIFLERIIDQHGKITVEPELWGNVLPTEEMIFELGLTRYREKLGLPRR